MNKSSTIVIAGGITVIVIIVIAFSISGGIPNKTTSYEKILPSVTQVMAGEIDSTYRWESADNKINPTLNFVANKDNVIEVKNLSDEKHEFVIESNGKEVAASGDVNPENSVKFTFKPDAVGTYEYHCEYHPDTMKGTIIVP